MSLKVVVQEAQKEARKWIVSHRASEFLALSSNILTFLSHHTTQIKAIQADCHNTSPLLDLPNPLKLTVIMSKMLLKGAQSILAYKITYATTPSLKDNVRRDDLLILHAPYTTYKYQNWKLCKAFSVVVSH